MHPFIKHQALGLAVYKHVPNLNSCMLPLGNMHYAMVAAISHDIAFGMCYVGCKGISHHHVICFWPCGMCLDHLICFSKTTENFNLGHLNVRHYY